MAPGDTLPDVLTVPEVAGFLRVNARTVYGLIRRGELQAFRVGRMMRCHRPDLLRFVDNQAVAATHGEDGRS